MLISTSGKSKFSAVQTFAFRCASCSCRAVALSAVRNMSVSVSKLSAAQLLHPAPLVETRKFLFVGIKKEHEY